ncbi:hypothetical protein C0992_002153 [Termitomyces sp. T32_za158]|nr:hypothetical protein C0992_002153 [Termitomyces sp. T32_za158]
MSVNVCTTRAKELLDTLPAKWDPRVKPPQLVLLDGADENSSEDKSAEQDWIQFDGTMVTSGFLAEVFRIFTSSERTNVLLELDPPIVTKATALLATDGSCTNNGDKDAQAGAGVFFAEGDAWNKSIKVPLNMIQSNQTGELLALKEAAESGPSKYNLNIKLDSKYVIN